MTEAYISFTCPSSLFCYIRRSEALRAWNGSGLSGDRSTRDAECIHLDSGHEWNQSFE
jgi:hypothetical protein